MDGLSINEVEKEFIQFLTFSEEDVLQTTLEKAQRTQLLYMAMILGNTFRNKVTVIFRSEEGMNQVHTTVWASTDTCVVLKGGATIPAKSILDVKIF
jgi:hypothetical protein